MAMRITFCASILIAAGHCHADVGPDGSLSQCSANTDVSLLQRKTQPTLIKTELVQTESGLVDTSDVALPDDCWDACLQKSGYCDICEAEDNPWRACCKKGVQNSVCDRVPEEDRPVTYGCVDVAKQPLPNGIAWLANFQIPLGALTFSQNGLRASLTPICRNIGVNRIEMDVDDPHVKVKALDLEGDCVASGNIGWTIGNGLPSWLRHRVSLNAQMTAVLKPSSYVDIAMELPNTHADPVQVNVSTCYVSVEFDLKYSIPGLPSNIHLGMLEAAFDAHLKQYASSEICKVVRHVVKYEIGKELRKFTSKYLSEGSSLLARSAPPTSNASGGKTASQAQSLTTIAHERTQSKWPWRKDLNADCWYSCGNKAGWCVACGVDYACCRQGHDHEIEECGGSVGGKSTHECVASPIKESWLKSLTYRPFPEEQSFDLVKWTRSELKIQDVACGGGSVRKVLFEATETGFGAQFLGVGNTISCSAKWVLKWGWWGSTSSGALHVKLLSGSHGAISALIDSATDGTITSVTQEKCSLKLPVDVQFGGHPASWLANAAISTAQSFFEDTIHSELCKAVSGFLTSEFPAVLNEALENWQKETAKVLNGPSR